jgi:TonB-linked SusC/RagA family outer membrane protein
MEFRKINSSVKAKLLLVMRISAIHGMIVMLTAGLATAHVNDAQILEKKVTININHSSFENALSEIELATGIKFAYSIDRLDISGDVSLTMEDRTLKEVLNELLLPRRILYRVHEKASVIALRKQSRTYQRTSAEVPEKNEGHRILVSGTVTDASTQAPMAGVTILVKGTTIGTTTDPQGKFSIESNPDDILVFSFIGFTSTERQVGDQTVIDIALEEDVKKLDEVTINAGYYTTTRASQTGNIARVGAKDIAKQPVSNPLAALIARVPGLEITQQTGVPGGNFKVRIRGTNSIANGNDPLYIIDGVPFISSSLSFLETSGNILGNPNPVAGQGSNPLNSINPADIESIEILKDADATAIYGSRGSNGIILITTKKGKPGKTKVDLNAYAGIAQVANHVELLNRQQYLNIRKEAFANDNIAPTTANAPDLVLWDTTRFTDWQQELLGGTARTYDAQLAISGGDASTQFSIGGGYHRETTVFPGDNSDQRGSFRFNLSNISPGKKLKTSASMYYAVNTSDLLNRDLTEFAVTLPPTAPALYDENGNISWVNWTAGFENPVAYLKRRYESSTQNLNGNAIISYEIIPHLEIKSSFGYTSNQSRAYNLVPISSLNPAVATFSQNTTAFSNSNFRTWIAEPQLNWKPRLEKGQFDVLVGTTFLDQTTEGLAQTGSGFVNEALMKNISAATTRTMGTNFYSQYRYHALFGRLNYRWNEKYFINLTARRDGSSRFGPGKQFATFGAIGAGWLFSEESFVQNALPFLSFGKLRASYGSTGNDQLGDYQFLDTYTVTGSGLYQSASGITPARLNNPNFAWETNHKLEAALELGFFKDRLFVSASFFRNVSSNQLVGYPLPTTTGFTSIQGNFPATVKNSGVEIELAARILDQTEFLWNVSFNMTIPKNKLVEFPDLNTFPAYANRYVVGEPLSILKLYNYTGIDPATGRYTFQDVNSDGLYNIEDRKTILFMGQEFYGGISNSFQYKGFQLDVLVQFVKQTAYDNLQGIPGSTYKSYNVSVLDRWQQPGDQTNVPRASTIPTSTSTLYANSQESLTNASFLRLKNMSFSYTLPSSWTKKMFMTQTQLFIQGQNLFTITPYKKGLDPEVTNITSLPPLRTITAGLHLTF